MKVLLLSMRPLGAAEIDRVLLAGLRPSAVDVCSTLPQAIDRLQTLIPDLVIVNLPEPTARAAVRALQPHVTAPIVVVAAGERVEPAESVGMATAAVSAEGGDHVQVRRHPGEIDVIDDPADEPMSVPTLGPGVTDALDAETRWLLYDVAAIGHVLTTPDGDILASNDIAAQLLGHFSPDALEAAGAMPTPLLAAAGAFSLRPSRFELCLQHGEDGPLHWIVGLALPQGGVPATVTWFLIDVSEQRLHGRRARFLRRMDALTHVLSAATAECSTLVDVGGRALASAREVLTSDVDVDAALQSLSRTQAVLMQLAGFARRRARRPVLRDLRALIDQISPVLVHVTGDDVTWQMYTGDHPLHASIDAPELEQCLAALATQGREALPLGGQMRLTLSPAQREGSIERGEGTRPDITITIELQGYGLQPVVIPPTVQTQVMRLGAELATDQPDHLTARIVLRLPRVFVTG